MTTDELAVGRLAAAHLLSLGLPHFAFFGTRRDYHVMLRAEGFKESIGASGLSCHVFLSGSPRAPGEPEADEVPLEAWIRQLPKPIGILAGADSLALQLLALCRKLEIDVPKSVAVLGVDNDDVFCELANPPLSSIALSTQEIGYEVPFLPWGTSLFARYRRSEGEVVEDPFEPANIESVTWTASVGLGHPLVRTTRQRLWLGIVGERRRSLPEMTLGWHAGSVIAMGRLPRLMVAALQGVQQNDRVNLDRTSLTHRVHLLMRLALEVDLREVALEQPR